MLSWQNYAGCMAAAGLSIGLLSAAGCRQVSHNVRSEEPVLRQASPIPPGYDRPPTPNLEAVPESSTNLSLPPGLLPPPAPPMEETRRSPSLNAWDREPLDLVGQEDAEFFAEPVSSVRPDFVTERASAQATRLAAEGRAARQRKEIRQPLWPVITPGVSSLKPVTAQEPSLMPVP